MTDPITLLAAAVMLFALVVGELTRRGIRREMEDQRKNYAVHIGFLNDTLERERKENARKLRDARAEVRVPPGYELRPTNGAHQQPEMTPFEETMSRLGDHLSRRTEEPTTLESEMVPDGTND